MKVIRTVRGGRMVNASEHLVGYVFGRRQQYKVGGSISSGNVGGAQVCVWSKAAISSASIRSTANY